MERLIYFEKKILLYIMNDTFKSITKDLVVFIEEKVGPDVTKYILSLLKGTAGDIFQADNGKFYAYNGNRWIDIGFC